MDKTATFSEHRAALFGIAYRLLGSVHDAEDVLQDAYIRWEKADAADVRNPRAFLTSIVTRLGIDLLRSAHKNREVYVGKWLPEPLVASDRRPDETLDLAESLQTAFLLMLERLNPNERAAFLLREVFDYPYPEIAGILEKSEENCRQIVTRAKQHVRSPKKRFDPTDMDQDRLVHSFISAADTGDLDALVSILADDAEMHTDHGGKAIAARRTLYSAINIAKFFVGIRRRLMPPDSNVRVTTVNGGPGIILYEGGAPTTAISLDIADGKIRTVYAMRNPDKLTHLPGLEAGSGDVLA